jgi:Protein of unknown function (DUF1464)
MAVHIGIDCSSLPWKTCVAEHENILECSTFEDIADLYIYLESLHSKYPDASIALAIQPEIALMPLHIWYEDQQAQAYFDATAQTLNDFLIASKDFSPSGYLLPAIRYLPTIPAHRRLIRESLGSAGMLCIVMTLLHHMRQQGAVWSELTFGCLELMDAAYRLTMIREGQIIDGTALWQPFRAPAEVDGADDLLEQVLLEQLSRELAGLMAIHHCEDIVLLDHTSGGRIDSIIEHFADLYQIFLYPPAIAALAGFEIARGASLLAAGLDQSGLAEEIVQQLFALTKP